MPDRRTIIWGLLAVVFLAAGLLLFLYKLFVGVAVVGVLSVVLLLLSTFALRRR